MGIYDREYYRGDSRGANWFAVAPPVCRALVVLNVLVFLAERLQILSPEFIANHLIATSDHAFGTQPWVLLTATFLHATTIHLVVNMLFLWVVGREMEAMYGPREFLAFYLTAAVVSTLGWAACDRLAGGHDQMLGASGAVLAVVVLYALYYPRREILFMFVIPIEMWLLVALFIGYQFFLLFNGGNVAVAVESHLSGAAYGYLYKRFDLRWSRLSWPRRHRPRLRIVTAEPVERSAVRPSGPTWSPNAPSIAKPSATAVLPEEQLDARLDEVLAKIAREGRGGLTEEENKVLQEASRRARNKRSDRL